MSPNWVAPYLSGAHNLTTPGRFKVNLDEIEHYKKIDDSFKEDQFKFKKKTNLIPYFNNSIGYVYLVKMATTIFPFLGDQMAIIVLQCLFHLFISIIFLTLKEFSNRQKWLFLILYAINPLILKFVVFNFYYFWQVIPAFIFGYLMLSKSPNKFIITFFLLILPVIIVTRPTIVFSLLFVIYLLFKKFHYKYGLFSVCYIIVTYLLINAPTKQNVWHTIYIGIGGYSNDYNIKLSDTSGYALYENKTNEKLNASVGGNLYNEITLKKYTEIAKNETIEIFNRNPILFLKNAIVNTLQGFSIGYINKAGDTINYIIAFTGFLMVCLLIYSKKYLWFFMISFSLGTFTLYYPPVQAYMYGVYLLLVLYLITNYSLLSVSHNLK
ncbi:hypothetical protein JBL43_10025 [Aureibaculum sp. A20]|uniref:Glycosyltransferase RgtA/B/C/D-like domain-containing protein n=2 Tax=Aureibaculum flavum TaxID=2795986 RepID=A0ABS0WRK5_9FLAO|nr:hypothetical protein [Aureibaculum flavum]